MKNNDQSSILMLKEIKRDKEILNSPSDETKLPVVLFTCFFSHFVLLFYTENFQVAINIYHTLTQLHII